MMSGQGFGERLRAYRERSGKTRAVLGGLVGRSAEWVKAVETGRLQMPRLPMLIRLADVLGVDVADLAGDPTAQRSRTPWGQLVGVEAIRAVLYYRRLAGHSGDIQAHLVSVLRERVAVAWQIWHGSKTRRTDVTALLPSLLADCQDAASASSEPERRAAHAVLADACHLAQHALVDAVEPELLWLVVERGMAAAQVADDPLSLAGPAWTMGMMLRGAGRVDESLALTGQATDLLQPHLPDAPSTDWLGMWGALKLHSACTAARAGRDGEAWAYWDSAATAARTLPPPDTPTHGRSSVRQTLIFLVSG